MFKTKKGIYLFFFLIWGLVFLGPFLKNMQHVDHHSINRMMGEWIFLFILFLVFLLNSFVLVPKFLFNDKRLRYGLMLGISILVGIVADVMLHQWVMPHEINTPPDRSYDFNNDAPFEQFSLLGTVFNNLIISSLIIGASTGFELFYKWLHEERMRKELEKMQLETSLALLKHQVSPHFLMNTLNNIHSLIEINTAKAQDAVERLSTLMRYLLYDSAKNKLDIKKEIEFVNSFISLMQLRYSEEVDVKIVIPENIPGIQIPPMLFISLLENAFKHGVCYPHKSYIYFELLFDTSSLTCIIKNSKHKIAANSLSDYSGIGLKNIKESLKLLYEDNFLLNIIDKENDFEVKLKIPI